MNVYTLSRDRFGHIHLELCDRLHYGGKGYGVAEAAREHQQARRSRLDGYRALAEAGRPLFGKVRR